MQLTVIIALTLAVALALAVRVWHRRVHETPEARYRKDIKALKRSADVWSAGADPGPDPAHPHSRSTKAAAWATLGAVGGCGGCGGCGCGG